MSNVSKHADHAKLEVNGYRGHELYQLLNDCQNEVDVINLQSSDEILVIEQKYTKLRRPFYLKRGELVKRIPNFWVTALITHPKIRVILDDDEEDCLQSMSALEVDEGDDIKLGYRIYFYFDDNPYFENKVLCKEFTLDALSMSTAIKWKEGKDLLEQVLAKSYRHNEKRNSEYKSFFDWFSDDTAMVDDKIAEAIRDELWVNPVQYYRASDIEADSEEDGEHEGK